MKMRLMIMILSFGSLSLVHSATASRIDVVNENKKSLKIKVKAEGSDVQENLATYTKEIPADQNSTFVVDRSDLKGKSYYSIKGDTNPFTPGDKCHHLSVEKDYKVTFLNDAVGTTCLAEEVKK